MRDARGGGSLRQRRPGVWEVRVAVGPDPVSGRSRYRSLTVHGDREAAQAARERWAAKAELVRSSGRTRPGITLADLLREWLCADHAWRPSTVAGYRSVAGFLTQDPVGKRRAVDLTPKVLTAACADWRSQGWPDPTVWARMRVLRSALGWAYTERILDVHPLDGMRSPPHAAVRMHAPVDQVRAILASARQQAIDAAIRQGRRPSDRAALHRAEQTLLLTRLAADSGALRGELAARGRVSAVRRSAVEIQAVNDPSASASLSRHIEDPVHGIRNLAFGTRCPGCGGYVRRAASFPQPVGGQQRMA